MSFEKMKVADLREVAVEFGAAESVDEVKTKKKSEIIAILEEEGVDYDEYARVNAIKDAAEKETKETITPDAAEVFQKGIAKDKLVLVRMDRKNPYFEVRSQANLKAAWKFSVDHPFQAMSEDEAQAIFDNFTGFRIATPSEAKEYYG